VRVYNLTNIYATKLFQDNSQVASLSTAPITINNGVVGLNLSSQFSTVGGSLAISSTSVSSVITASQPLVFNNPNFSINYN
jgi:hypothetical protein